MTGPAENIDERAKPSRKRWRLFAALAVVLGLVPTFTLAELGLALAGRGYNYDEPAMHFDVADAQAGFWYKPHFRGRWRSDHHEFDTRPSQNGAGMRGARDYAAQPPPGVLRIALLGDSLVRGLEVEDNEAFSAVLEEFLNAQPDQLSRCRLWPFEQPPRAVEVLNFARSGASTAVEASILKFKVLPFSPHVVLHFAFPNDVPEDNMLVRGGHIGQTDDDGIVSQWLGMEVSDVQPGWKRLLRRSHVVNFAYRLWRYRRQLRALEKSGGKSAYYGSLLHDSESDEVKGLWATSERFLRAEAALCKQHRIGFVLCAIPFPPQVEPAHADYRGMNFEFRTSKVLESTAFQDHLARFCAAEGVTYFDLLGGFRAAKTARPDQRLFFDLDQHLTAAGHRAIAHLLADWLCPPSGNAQ